MVGKWGHSYAMLLFKISHVVAALDRVLDIESAGEFNAQRQQARGINPSTPPMKMSPKLI